MQENFENIEKQVIKWFLKKDAPTHLKGFKYTVHILVKRLIGEWNEDNICLQYSETGEHFDTSKSKVERCIRHFIEKSGEKQINSEYLAKCFYLIKMEE